MFEAKIKKKISKFFKCIFFLIFKASQYMYIAWAYFDSVSYICRYLLQYQEPIPCEQLVSTLCDLKQAYTQYGGKIIYEPPREKTDLRGFIFNLAIRPGPTQISLYSDRRWLEARYKRYEKKRDCTFHVGKTKGLFSFVVTAKLICVFVFA